MENFFNFLKKIIEFHLHLKNPTLSEDEIKNSETSSECTNSEETYDSFNTSDSDILKKEEMKIKLLNDYIVCECGNGSGITSNTHLIEKSKDEFNILFIHMLKELKKENNKGQLLKPIDLDESSSDDDCDYLHGYKFF